MTTLTESALLEQIQRQLRALPPEKQHEVLYFILALQRRMSMPWPVGSRRLCEHHPMPPVPGQVYPPVGLQAVTEF